MDSVVPFPPGNVIGVEWPRFYFSFSAPESYLVAERVLGAFDGPCEWIPVRLPKEVGIDRGRFEQVAAGRGLQPVLWPPDFDEDLVLRAATFAKSIGRTVSFALAALRQAYAGGADLSDINTILIAAAACEMHPRAVIAALDRAAIGAELDRATDEALALGVTSTPTVWQPGGSLLVGDAALPEVVAS